MPILFCKKKHQSLLINIASCLCPFNSLFCQNSSTRLRRHFKAFWTNQLDTSELKRHSICTSDTQNVYSPPKKAEIFWRAQIIVQNTYCFSNETFLLWQCLFCEISIGASASLSKNFTNIKNLKNDEKIKNYKYARFILSQKWSLVAA